jgi:hypothetical protein
MWIMPRCVRISVAIGFFTAAEGGFFAHAAGQDVTLEVIRAELTQWEQSFVQFWIVWQTEWDPHSELARQHAAEGIRSISRDEWARTVRGEEYWHNTVTNDDRLQLRSLRTRNAEGVAYSAMYERGESDPDRPTQLAIAPVSSPGDSVIRAPFLGLWVNRAGTWLGSALLEYPARLDGTTTWEGRELPLLVVETAAETELQLALDPEFGYLPRTSRIVHVGADETRLGHLYETLEFREIQPGLFFPWSGRVHNPNNASTWQILEIELNDPLEHIDFDLQPADGTFVENLITGESGYHGAPPPAALVPIPDPTPTTADSSPAGAAVSRTPWNLLLAVAGIALLASAWFLHRSRST